MTKSDKSEEYVNRLSAMQYATQHVQRLIFWCAVNGEMTEGQAYQIECHADYLARTARSIREKEAAE